MAKKTEDSGLWSNRCRGHNCGAAYPNNGALWNGMTAPFVNMTIFGALYYQGENNVYECQSGSVNCLPARH